MTQKIPAPGRRTTRRRNEIRGDFDYCDGNKDGRIGRKEFATFMNGLGAGMSPEELAIGFDAIDADGDGHISWEEFVAWWGEE
jgi:calmodulin